MLRTELVAEQHKLARLLTAAADGHIGIEGDDRHPVLRRRDADGPRSDREVRDALDKIFSGRTTLALGSRDYRFREGWDDLSIRLDRWRRTSGLWDAEAERRARLAGIAGLFAALAGLALTITGGVPSGRRLAAGLPFLPAAAVITGTAVALVGRHRELERRSPRGASLWLWAGAFRRYPAGPSACPGELPGGERLDRCTAWAVALGVGSAWEEAVGAAASPAITHRHFTPDGTAVLLTAVALSAGSPPSGSGGGGSGGGSSSGDVGGGAGGGGGGSW